jgi:hypothetical protein
VAASYPLCTDVLPSCSGVSYSFTSHTVRRSAGLPTEVGVRLRHYTFHTMHLYSYFVQLSCLVIFSPTSTVWFSGAFTKLRKAIIIFVISVRPSACLWVRVKNTPPIGYNFIKFAIFVFFENLSIIFTSIKIWRELRALNLQTNMHFLPYLAQFFLEWEMFHTKFVEKIETYFTSIFNNLF